MAEIGALNFLNRETRLHRRDALWQVERAARGREPLFDSVLRPDTRSPLRQMDAEERLVSDYRVTGLTTGPHPMALCRERLNRMGILRASDLGKAKNGTWVKTAGCVIARQRPGTAKGFVFLSLEDETGIANAIFTPDMLQENRATITTERFILLEGWLQHQDNVISVKARRVRPLSITNATTTSRDFH